MAQRELIHPVSAELLTRQHEHRSELVWNGQGIRDAGFESVFLTGTMRHDAGLIIAFVDRWRPETHTFHLRFGDATITLWMVPVEAVHVQRHSACRVCYELDHMVESSFIWMPYVDSAPQAHDIPADERIPTTSPHIGHHTFYGSISRWHLSMETVIELWEHRHEGIIATPTYMPSRRPMSVDGYRTWYDRVTRRYMINPTVQASKEGFLGSQGLLPIAAEGLSNAYHEIQSSEVAADDPIVDSALQGMEVILDDTGFHVLQDRRPHPPPMVPTGRRRPRTRGGSTSTTIPHPRPAPLDGYVSWGQPWLAMDQQDMVLLDLLGRTLCRGMGMHLLDLLRIIPIRGLDRLLRGMGLLDLLWSILLRVVDLLILIWSIPIRGLDRLLRGFMTTERGFQPFMSHDTSGSRYASPVICEDDDGDDEEPHYVQVRQ
ncbi:hypothetical protein AgCh_024232 [Apium graveolens]